MRYYIYDRPSELSCDEAPAGTDAVVTLPARIMWLHSIEHVLWDFDGPALGILTVTCIETGKNLLSRTITPQSDNSGQLSFSPKGLHMPYEKGVEIRLSGPKHKHLTVQHG
jgi:hypothetical protein